jgi:hypothetical protein
MEQNRGGQQCQSALEHESLCMAPVGSGDGYESDHLSLKGQQGEREQPPRLREVGEAAVLFEVRIWPK